MPNRTPVRLSLGSRTLLADGAMGSMLQSYDLTDADFAGYDGCNEMLNLTRPEIVAEIHRAYFDAGSDLVETNTFGANLTALAEYGLVDRLEELAEAGARIARHVADEVTTEDHPRWVLGSIGPGTKLASLGQVTYAEIRDASTRQTRAMLRGGIDAVIIETVQDLLNVRAAVAGAKIAIREAGADCPIIVSVTLETSGTLLVGSDISAIVATLVPLGIDALGLNCATGPDAMRPHLTELTDISPLPITCMPNAGLPVLTDNGAYYPLSPDDFANAVSSFVRTYGLSLVGGCCGTTPEHIAALSMKLHEIDAHIQPDSRAASAGPTPLLLGSPKGAPAPVGCPPTGRARNLPDGSSDEHNDLSTKSNGLLSSGLREPFAERSASAGSSSAESRGAETFGAESRGAESFGAESRGAESFSAESRGAETFGAEYLSDGRASEQAHGLSDERSELPTDSGYSKANESHDLRGARPVGGHPTGAGTPLGDPSRSGVGPAEAARPRTRSTNAVASLYTATDLTQDISYLSIGERTNASGSRAFRDAMIAGDWEECVQIAREQVAEGAHVLDLCVDYVGRDGCADMAELAGRISREVDIPIAIDSSNPEVIRTGLELIPGRAIVNSVNFESGEGPGSRFDTVMGYAREHGAAVVALCIDEEGQARTVERKLEMARRFVSVLTGEYGMDESDIIIDPLTFPISTGQEENRRDAANTIEATRRIREEFPRVHILAGVSNVSFGLKPSARAVLNSVYLDQCREAGLDAAIVPTARILPLSQIPQEKIDAAMDLIWDRGENPLERYLSLFEGGQAKTDAITQEMPIEEKLRRHILQGTASGLEDDLNQAVQTKPALDIINEDLLSAMKEVGERFGSGKMQLPFVLKSAEVMKKAVTLLEPHLDKVTDAAKGTLVLATVRGDVHDIGKNLVDIILTNNGYRVVNLGIKQPIADIISAAEEVGADAIGMSGLLVKSTQVMKENLEELNEQGLGAKYPVLLGGAALTRDFVDTDLTEMYTGQVRYAKDAFEGLALMDAVMAGDLPAVAPHRLPKQHASPATEEVRSDVTRPVPGGVDVPVPPFLGVRQGAATLAEVIPWLDRRALFAGQWGLKSVPDGPTYEQLAAEEGEPRLAHWLDEAAEQDLFDFQVVWGYWHCHSNGDDLILDGGSAFTFPRQGSGAHLCIADYFRDEQESSQYGPDVIGLQLVTAGKKVGRCTAELFAEDSYRDYFELHGLSVQMTEAFAEMWHSRIRTELGLTPLTNDISEMVSHQKYTGARFSFGYPACPDLDGRRTVAELLKPETIGVTLTEECQLVPEQSTDALIVHHPQAHYFSVR